MPLAQRDATASDLHSLAPGMTVEVRDEQWLVTAVEPTSRGLKLAVRGTSDYVRDTTATFFTSLDEVRVFDPTDVHPTVDTTPGFRRTRLWLEAALRNTPVPLHQAELSVATQMLADPLDYQLQAVRTALATARDNDYRAPRILIADAVGLGKTLEMGMILAELIRRGRANRILVVTPKHVMEQMQHELWCRFAIPLVRLDSQGIAAVRQKLPASRNPFTYFPRVIVSMDTLKSAKYRAQLEKVTWDAVIIDEIHNATNIGTQNNQLARTLAPTTDALILASATPHNGDPESFKEILRLLDPTAVTPDGIDPQAAKRLIIRRHRHSEEVAAVVGDSWARRAAPRNILVEASAEENAVAKDLHDTWLAADAPMRGADHLFPWTLVKAYLSSPAALLESITNRLKKHPSPQLEHLKELAENVTPQNSNKYAALVNYLTEIGVSKRSPTRAVVFSERVATLYWLRDNLTTHLKLGKDAIAVLHGGLSDIEQMRIIDEFKREDTPIKVLITGDVASEGVNLHSQCHHLVHFDIPWSLIRIQQRNGRIDRYGQTHSPVIATLLLDPADEHSPGELAVLQRLMEREAEAFALLGDSASLMGVHTVQREEDTIRDVLRGIRDFDDVVLSPHQVAEGITHDGEHTDPANSIDALLAMLSMAPAPAADPTAHQAGLYPTELDFLTDALTEGFAGVPQDSPARGGVSFRAYDHDIAELVPPRDLQQMLSTLPQQYLRERQVTDKLLLATTPARGAERLQAARSGHSDSTWPTAHFLGPLHPVTAWASARALSTLDRKELPVIAGTVETPTVLLMGTLTTANGQVVSRAFVTAAEGFFGLQAEVIADPVAWLHDHGLSLQAVNPGDLHISEDFRPFIRRAVDTTSAALEPMRLSAIDAERDLVRPLLLVLPKEH